MSGKTPNPSFQQTAFGRRWIQTLAITKECLVAKAADFMVVLRNEIPPQDAETLFPVLKSYTMKTGTVARVIWCKEVEFSHLSYLVVEALRQDESGTTHMHIPHWAVFTIVGSKNSPPVGFVWADESPVQPKALGK